MGMEGTIFVFPKVFDDRRSITLYWQISLYLYSSYMYDDSF